MPTTQEKTPWETHLGPASGLPKAWGVQCRSRAEEDLQGAVRLVWVGLLPGGVHLIIWKRLTAASTFSFWVAVIEPSSRSIVSLSQFGGETTALQQAVQYKAMAQVSHAIAERAVQKDRRKQLGQSIVAQG